MPSGKYSLYLYHDDCRDMQARETIEQVSQPLRGKFLRATAVAGAVLYRIDVRLPAALTALFVGSLQPGHLTGLLSLLSGRSTPAGEGADDCYPWEAGRFTGSAERRRFNLNIDDECSTLLTQLLDDASSRQRSALLRELVIAGCALHVLDNRFPQLLSSMPEPPASVADLLALTIKLLGRDESADNAEKTPVRATEEPAENDVSALRQNMKKLF